VGRALKAARVAVKNPTIEGLCALAAAGLDRRVRVAEDLDAEPPRRILVIRTDRIGDLLCGTPLIAALHERWPAAEITLVGGPRNRAVMPLLPYLRRAPVEFVRHPWSWARLAAWAPRQRFDLAVSLRSEVFSGAWIAARSRARVRMVANASRTLPAFNLVLGPHDHHSLRRYWRAAWRLGATWPGPPRPIFTIPARAELRAAAVWASLGIADRACVVGIGIPNRSTRRHAFKAWPPERLEALARTLREEGRTVLLFGVGAERQEAERLAGRVPGLRVAPPLSLAEVAAVQRRLRLLVSSLTGTLHLADGVGTPTVAIGEARSAADWRPLGPRHHVVTAPVPAAIPFAAVLAAVRQALGDAGPAEPGGDANGHRVSGEPAGG
jgi:ADP-heptose:LPS heptosyltransferase